MHDSEPLGDPAELRNPAAHGAKPFLSEQDEAFMEALLERNIAEKDTVSIQPALFSVHLPPLASLPETPHAPARTAVPGPASRALVNGGGVPRQAELEEELRRELEHLERLN
eukprot:7832358-Pyramimonas_sp.AAC.1